MNTILNFFPYKAGKSIVTLKTFDFEFAVKISILESPEPKQVVFENCLYIVSVDG